MHQIYPNCVGLLFTYVLYSYLKLANCYKLMHPQDRTVQDKYFKNYGRLLLYLIFIHPLELFEVEEKGIKFEWKWPIEVGMNSNYTVTKEGSHSRRYLNICIVSRKRKSFDIEFSTTFCLHSETKLKLWKYVTKKLTETNRSETLLSKNQEIWGLQSS